MLTTSKLAAANLFHLGIIELSPYIANPSASNLAFIRSLFFLIRVSDPLLLITCMPLGAMGGVGAALLLGVLFGFSVIADGLNLWPMPASVSHGSGTLYPSKDFQLNTDGSKFSDGSGILKDAFSRMIDGIAPSYGVLDGLHVVVFSTDDKLNFGTDETNKLSIPGSKKSLCYQVPPLMTGKTAVVISPLLSLMQDQVISLKQWGIKAEHLGSSQIDQTAYSYAEKGAFDILNMTPEKACLLPKRFWSNLLNLGICLLAVDEAHCISEWGHDFRKEYKQLDKLREVLLNVPFMGLTEKVRHDILWSLKMIDPCITIRSFDRKNLFYGVKPRHHSQSFLDELVKEVSKYNASGGSTIIYCTTVKDTEQICQLLRNTGIVTEMYHGQMGSKARERSHRSFIRDEVQAIALIGEIIGTSSFNSMIVLGLVIPAGPPLSSAIVNRIELFSNELMLPFFLANASRLITLDAVVHWRSWVVLTFVLVLLYVSKFVWTFLPVV